MTNYLLALLLVVALVPAHAGTAAFPAAVPEACDEEWVDREVRAPATAVAAEVKISCHLSLRNTDTISKRLVFDGAAATGVIVDCNGASLDPRGTVNEDQVMISIVADYLGNWQWDTPENISITDCTILGSVKMHSGGGNQDLSHNSDYPQRKRAGAPKHITLDNLEIVGTGQKNLVYLHSGVTEVTLINSHLRGDISGVPLYLDAESGYNTIKGNRIEVNTNRREQLAIDGSSHNLIISNHFSGLDTGGIYLYRNCGEGGTIRHTTPSFNQIINNYFYYERYTEENPDHWGETLKPAIFVGSRHTTVDVDHVHCNADNGFPFGSSIDDRDLARHNVIAQNQIRKRELEYAIRSNSWVINSPNYLLLNERVEERIDRGANCYTVNGTTGEFTLQFILHGETIQIPRLMFFETYRCDDGELVPGHPPSKKLAGGL